MNSHYPAPGEIPAPHPASEIFPLMEGAEFDALVKDIKRNGLRQPLVLLDNLVLDGRNRLRACLEAKVDPQYRFFDPKRDGKSPIAFVMSSNAHRRQMTPGQLAAVAALALPMFEAEAAQRQSSTHFRTASAEAATPAPKPKAEEKPAENAEKWEKTLRMVAEAMGTLPVLQKALATGCYADGSIMEPEGVGRTQEQIAELKKTIADHPEAVKEIEERAARIDGTHVELDPEAINGGGDDEASQVPTTRKGAGTKPPRQRAPKPPEPEPTKGKAAAQAAAAVGVSTASVEAAKQLQKTAPEKFEEVKKGRKSLHAAAIEAKLDSPEVQDALLKIRRVCGQSLHDAAKEQTRLKGAKEILAYAALDEATMIETRGLIDSGWTVKEAVKYKAGALTKTHRITDLLNRAAHAGGMLTLEVDCWVISVTRKADEMPATAAADATKAAKRRAAKEAK